MTINPRLDGLGEYKRYIRVALVHDEATIADALDSTVRVLES